MSAGNRGACFALALLLTPAVILGCDASRRDWGTCYTHDCGPGRVCTVDHRCVSPIDAGVADGGAADAHAADAPEAIAGVTTPDALDSATASEAPGVDAGEGEALASGVYDATIDAELDAVPGTAVDAEIDAPGDASVAIDTRIPDAVGTCFADGDCAGRPNPYCLAGLCVACKTSGECRGGAPICSSDHLCVSCVAAVGACPSAAPACEADSGRCVECASNDDCPVATRPICDGASNTCVACASDEQCAAVPPAVCMYHLDGRCASEAETVHVGSSGTATCSDTAPDPGSALVPYCTAQKGVRAANAKGKPLVVMVGALLGEFTGIALTSRLTVVGKNAIITPADFSDGIGVTSGEIYLRGLTVAGSLATQTGIGINAQATTGAALVLHMEGCTVTGNPGGGILLGGAAFDIRNTVISGNGPGQTTGGATFGGIRVEGLPAAGPTSLELVTLENNLAPGLSCLVSIQGNGVLASGNGLPQITNSCGVVPCSPASTSCGAR